MNEAQRLVSCQRASASPMRPGTVISARAFTGAQYQRRGAGKRRPLVVLAVSLELLLVVAVPDEALDPGARDAGPVAGRRVGRLERERAARVVAAVGQRDRRRGVV